MEREFTAIIEKRGRWYVAYVEEIPGVNTQGKTLAEARRNLKDSLRMVLEVNQDKSRQPKECLSGRTRRSRQLRNLDNCV